jgi:1-acyl-sn-glycerol-3-phosphate acyltransferase
MKFLKLLHTTYGVILFTILFLIFFPFFLIAIVFKDQHQMVGILNRWWARLLFLLVGIPYEVEYKSKLNPKQQYIFCPNHFSYLDIAIMGLNTHNTIFVGKNDMVNIPLFGYMYRKLHITVDRTKLKSRYSTMLRSLEALHEGKSLVIFPEGGIITESEPVMAKFKDGAFRAAIEKQIPIVPVTIPYNWIILPPNEFLLTWRFMKVIFHQPVDPKGYTIDDIDRLKQEVRNIIESELQFYLQHENRSGTSGQNRAPGTLGV